MDKKANSYVVMVIVLLLVACVITGAGLCYLSWTDEALTDTDHAVIETVVNEIESDEAEETTETWSESQIQETETVVETTETVSEESTEETVSEEGSEETSEYKITMDDITINEKGEYEYQKDGVVSKKGIDVSKYQGKIDWKKTAQDGVTYAMLRVGCRGYGAKGTLLTDEMFAQNAKGALENGIEIGAYFFSQAITKEEALEEAELVIKQLEGYDVTYPVAMDIEVVKGEKARQDDLSIEQRTEICIAFCGAIKEAGYTPMIYGDLNTFEHLLDTEKLTDYDFWICETDGQMTFSYPFAIWQYSHEGSVAGITGETNLSISVKEW